MNSYKLFFIFLFAFFMVFPLLLNYPPRRICRFFHRKQYTPSYPKFISFLLAISMIAFNTIYFACCHYSIGILLSSVLMFCLFNKKYSILLMQHLRNSDKSMAIFAIPICLMALSQYTFPIAIIMGLVMLFSCLMPKAIQTDIASPVDDATNVSDETTESGETVATSASEEATSDMMTEPSLEAETDSPIPGDNPSEHDDSSKGSNSNMPPSDLKKTKAEDKTLLPKANAHERDDKSRKRSQRPNRHCNGSNYKRLPKSATIHAVPQNSSKFSNKSNINGFHRRHG